MLTSLLSLYIASIIQTDIPTNTRTASLSFATQIENSNAPIKDPLFISPLIDAKSSIAVDIESGETLFEKNGNTRRPIASITKLMTILIILEENEMDEIVTVSNNAANTEGSTMFLVPGEKITIKNLLYGAMINSANDAAVALAEHNAESVYKFIEKMNQKSLDLGLLNTHFSNPIGLDEKNNYSSASDIATLGIFLYHSDFIKEAAIIKSLQVSSTSEKIKHKLESTNDLLDSFLDIRGLKTGKTASAGLCLVAIAANKEGKEIITVVLNSPARFQESKILIDWIFRAYKWNK